MQSNLQENDAGYSSRNIAHSIGIAEKIVCGSAGEFVANFTPCSSVLNNILNGLVLKTRLDYATLCCDFFSSPLRIVL